MPLPTVNNALCIEQPPIWAEDGCGVTGLTGEISNLYLTDTPPANIDVTDFVGAIDNAVAAPGAIIRIPLIGTLGEPTTNEQVAERGITLSSDPEFAFSGVSYNFTLENYEAARAIMYRKKSLYAYLGVGQYLMGGYKDAKDGIPTVVKIVPIFDGEGTFANLKIDFTWKAAALPEMVLNPDV